MADDINLPNLVSHLQVNLARTSGIAADAARQGSAVGAALGDSLRQRVVAATNNIPDVEINDNSSQVDRDLARVREQLQALGEQRIGVDISVEEALRRMNRLEPHLDRLARTHPNLQVQASVGQAARSLQDIQRAATRVDRVDPEVTVTVHADTHDVDEVDDRLRRVRGSVGRLVGTVAGIGGKIAAPFALASVAVGTLLPLVAGLVATLVNVAPAAALGVSAVIALQLATNTMKLAMVGVGDAVKAALDPAGATAYAEAIKKLSPEARSFTGVLRSMSPALDKLRRDVQDKVFRGFDEQLKATAKATLPSLKTGLLDTGRALNQMGVGVFTAARELGERGILGTALKGATTGLSNLRRAPGQVVTALGQIGAAAAPAFAKLTSSAGSALDRLSEKLTRAFESGAMQDAIELAISLIGQLGRIAGNVFAGIGNILKASSVDGGGFLGTLEKITQAFQDLTATKEFQSALGELSKTMSALVAAVLPLVGEALKALLPVIQILAPPIRELITHLGAELQPVIQALGPVLAKLAEAFVALIPVVLPFVDLALKLAADILPILTPLFQALADVFTLLAPIAQQIADNLAAQLTPILEALPGILEQILPKFLELAEKLLPLLLDILVQIGPQLGDLAVQFADLLVELTPLLVKFLEFQIFLVDKMLPIIGPLAGAIGKTLVGALMLLTAFIRDWVIPIVQTICALLNGDWSSATQMAAALVIKLKESAGRAFESLKARATAAVTQMGIDVVNRVSSMATNFVAGVQRLVGDAVQRIATLPGQILGVLGGLGNLLFDAGVRIISGLIAGIQSRIPSVHGVLSGLTSLIPSWKGPRSRDLTLLTPAGKAIIRGLVAGISASTASLKSKLGQVTNLIERAMSINAGNKHKTSGLSSLLARVQKDNSRLLKLAASRDAIAKKLSAASKALGDLVKDRAKAAADIQSKILGEADIVGGNRLVNSVNAITIGLQAALAKTKAFAANIAKLKKSGLRGDLLQQIADAGVEGGSATAEALAKATPAELKRINDLQAQLAKAASATGTTVAGALYDAGIRAAQGLVDGLKKQQGAIVKQMQIIANAMVGTIKKALKIKSPSRVFQGIGELTGDGLREGMLRSRTAVAAASRSMAAAAVGAADVAARAFGSVPAPGALTAAYAGSGGGTTNNNTFNLYQTDASPDGILRALSWHGLVGRQ